MTWTEAALVGTAICDLTLAMAWWPLYYRSVPPIWRREVSFAGPSVLSTIEAQLADLDDGPFRGLKWRRIGSDELAFREKVWESRLFAIPAFVAGTIIEGPGSITLIAGPRFILPILFVGVFLIAPMHTLPYAALFGVCLAMSTGILALRVAALVSSVTALVRRAEA